MRKKMFYGWRIVIGGFILNFIGIGIGINTLGIFFKPVIETYGFSRGDFSFYFTIAALAMMFAAPLVGRLIEKFDVRLVMGASTFILAASFAAYSQCKTLTQFYVMAAVVGIGHAGSHILPVSTLINNWFREKRGLAMGIVYTATGLGGLIFNPLGNWLILSYGWRATIIILGAVIALVATPTAVIVMRKRPEDMGLYPDGAPGPAAGQAGVLDGYTPGEFIRTSAFWFLAIMIFLFNTLNSGVQQHLIPYLTDIGHSSTFAANIVALYLGMTVAGKLSLGYISDTKGLTTGLVIFCGILTAGIMILFGTRIVAVAIIWAIIYGIGNAVQTVIPPLMTAACAGIRHFAPIYGIIAVFQTVGTGLGMPLSGYLYDTFGDYNLAFGLCVVMCVAGAIMGVQSLKRARFARR